MIPNFSSVENSGFLFGSGNFSNHAMHSFHRLLLAGTPTTAKRDRLTESISTKMNLSRPKLHMPLPMAFERRCWRPRQQQRTL